VINPASMLNMQNKLSPQVKRLVDIFMSPDGIGRRYLFGRNEHSEALAKVIDIDCFIDDYTEEGAFWNGKPVVNSREVPRQAIIVNCSMCNMPVTASQRILKLATFGSLSYADLYHALPDLIPLPNFVATTLSDIKKNKEKCLAKKGGEPSRFFFLLFFFFLTFFSLFLSENCSITS